MDKTAGTFPNTSVRFGMDLDVVKLPPGDKAIVAGAIGAPNRMRDDAISKF